MIDGLISQKKLCSIIASPIAGEKCRFGNRKPDSQKLFAICPRARYRVQIQKCQTVRLSERVHARTVEAVVLSREAVWVSRHHEAFRGREKLLVSRRALLKADSVLV
jgi:hypothetical protein